MAVDQDPGLAGAGAGADEEGGWGMDRLLLLGAGLVTPFLEVAHAVASSTPAIQRMASAKCSGTVNPPGFRVRRSARR